MFLETRSPGPPLHLTHQVVEARAILAEMYMALGEMGNASASIAKATALLDSLSEQAMPDDWLFLKALQLGYCVYNNKQPHNIRQQLQVCKTAVQQSLNMESGSIRQALGADILHICETGIAALLSETQKKLHKDDA